MGEIDFWLAQWLNRFSQSSPLFDTVVVYFTTAHLLKGGVVVALLWMSWFKREPEQVTERNRGRLLSTLLFATFAVVVGRLLQRLLPFRIRPMHNPELLFRVPLSGDPEQLQHMSSFPSDHAILIVTIAAGICFVSRRIGAIAVAYTLFVIGFARMYAGYHYLSDILAGGLLGALMAVIANTKTASLPIGQLGTKWRMAHPASFYGFLFLLTYEIGELFEGTRFFVTAILRQLSIAPTFLQ